MSVERKWSDYQWHKVWCDKLEHVKFAEFQNIEPLIEELVEDS